VNERRFPGIGSCNMHSPERTPWCNIYPKVDDLRCLQTDEMPAKSVRFTEILYQAGFGPEFGQIV
jgi:hypothetical protein